MGNPARDRALSPVNPGDSAIGQEVCPKGPVIRPRCGVYHLVRPSGPPWPKGVWYPKPQTLNLKLVTHFKCIQMHTMHMQ